MIFYLIVLSITVLNIFFIFTNTPTNINGYPNDTAMLLDGAWRMYNGQVANLDFRAPLGPFTYYLISICMNFTGETVSSIAFASLLVFIGSLVFIPLLQDKFERNIIALLYLALNILIVTPRPMNSQAPEFITHAMIYNRWGYALLSILLIYLLVPDKESHKERKHINGFLLGLLLSILFIIKINYFVIALGALILPRNGGYRKFIPEYLAGFISFVLITACLTYLLNFSFTGYLTDISYASSIQHGPFRYSNFTGGLQYAADLLIYFILLIPVFYYSGLKGKAILKPAFVCIFILCTGLTFLFMNSDEKELFSLRLLLPLVFFTYYPSLTSNLKKSGIFLLSGFLCAFLLRDISTLVKIVFPTQGLFHHVRANEREEWKISDSYYENYLFSGAELIKNNIHDDKPVFIADFTDPFSFLLRRKPVKYSLVWWHNYVTFNKDTSPDMRKILCDAGWIATPKKPKVARERDLIRIKIASDVQELYTYLTENELWELHKRTKEC